jgi:hypothetical protein
LFSAKKSARAKSTPSIWIGPFESSRASQLADEFLSQVDFQSNPFLLSPARMIADGFKGTCIDMSLEVRIEASGCLNQLQ